MRIQGKPVYIFLVAIFCFIMAAGCSSLTTSDSGVPYYYAEFDDIPIPSALSGVKETTIITTPNGTKTGVQVFKGRVEVGSLNKAMISYMQRDGWEMRSSTRGTRSILIFEKNDRYCTIYILDGMLNTEMQVYVSPKLKNFGPANTNSYEAAPAPVNPSNTSNSVDEPSSSFDSQRLSE